VSDSWQPEGYSTPQQHTYDSRISYLWIFLIGILSAIPAYPKFIRGAERYAELVAVTTGLHQYPTTFAAVVSITGPLLCFLVFYALVIPIHEHIHYQVYDLFDAEPEHDRYKILLLNNPAVVPTAKGIPRRGLVLAAVAPFVVIGVVSGGVMLAVDGVVAMVAAFVFVGNSGASGHDLYIAYNFSKTPRGTVFAYFRSESAEGVSTEYAVPE
jgi:hypothetical protein